MDYRALRAGVLLIAGILPLAMAATSESMRQRRERVEKMSAAQKEELQRKENRFRNLPAADQQRLREMHSQINSAPDSEELRDVMERYYAWLKTLQPGQRAEILSLPPEERVKKIRFILKKQYEYRFLRFARTKLEDSDVPVIKDWVDRLIDRHREELLASLPEPQRREIERNPRPEGKRFMLSGALLQRGVSPEELENLASNLSSSAREVLKDAENDPSRQTLVIRSWVEAAMWASWFRRLDPVPQDELMRFLQEEVSPRERAELEELPAEHFRREAERLYHQNRFRKRMERGAINRPPPEDSNSEK